MVHRWEFKVQANLKYPMGFHFQVYLFKDFYFILYVLVLCLYICLYHRVPCAHGGLEVGVGPSDSEVMSSCHVDAGLWPQAHFKGWQYFWLLNHLSTHPFLSVLLRGMHCYFLQFLEVWPTIQCSLPMKNESKWQTSVPNHIHKEHRERKCLRSRLSFSKHSN